MKKIVLKISIFFLLFSFIHISLTSRALFAWTEETGGVDEKKEIKEINTLFVQAEKLYAEGRYKDARILYEKIDEMIKARKERKEPSWFDIMMGTDEPKKTVKKASSPKTEKAEKEPIFQFLDLTKWKEKKEIRAFPEDVPALTPAPVPTPTPLQVSKPEPTPELTPVPAPAVTPEKASAKKPVKKEVKEAEKSWFDILTFKKEKTPEELAKEAHLAAQKEATLKAKQEEFEQIKAEKLVEIEARQKEIDRIKAEREALKQAKKDEKQAKVEAKKAEKRAAKEEKKRQKEIKEAEKKAEALAKKNEILKRRAEEKMAQEARRKIEAAKKEKERARAARESVLRAKFMKAHGLPPEPGSEKTE